MKMNKKAYVTHPVTLFVVGLIIGIVLAYLVNTGIINIPITIGCK